MPSTSSLKNKLAAEYTDISFIEAEQFSWSPTNKTVFYTPDAANSDSLLLHELSHALLNHRDYRRDVELVAMETAAWEKAKQIAPTYSHKINDSFVQDNLDTYRDWLHSRSSCPNCTANGFQTEQATYECPACSHRWRVNEARLCGLKRYSI